MQKTENLFRGKFLTDKKILRQKLKKIKAYVFDWDGVFNNGHKTESGSSSFSEPDAMGTNLLRFSHYLIHQLAPFTAIITAENNEAAVSFAGREHFHAIYSGIKNKTDAFQNFCKTYSVEPRQVAFFFDDVLDLSVASQCGLRIMVGRDANPLLAGYVKKRNLADYITHDEGSNHAVRESAELIMALNGRFEAAVDNRISDSEKYRDYLAQKNGIATRLLTAKDLLS